jgi:hypothetical protein
MLVTQFLSGQDNGLRVRRFIFSTPPLHLL